MNILVDVDGVVANTHAAWLSIYNAEWNDDLMPHEVTRWELHKLVVPECGVKVYDYLRDPYLYSETQPMNDALEGIRQLREMGHRVVYVTAGNFPGKIEWLHRHHFLLEYPHGPENWETARDFVIASDKSIIKGDILIDDRYENVAEFHGHGILFDQPWNRQHPWSARCFGWAEVVDSIGRMG